MRPEAIDWFKITFFYLLNHFGQAIEVAAPIATCCLVTTVIISLMVDGKFRLKRAWRDWTNYIYLITGIWYLYSLLKPIFISQILLLSLLAAAVIATAVVIFILMREWVQQITTFQSRQSKPTR